MARASRALLVLATVTVAALLYFGHEVFIPVALALLFAMVLSNAVEGLHRLGLPRAVSAFLMLLLLVTGIGAATDALIERRRNGSPARRLHSRWSNAKYARSSVGCIAWRGLLTARARWEDRVRRRPVQAGHPGSDKRLRGPVGDGCNAR